MNIERKLELDVLDKEQFDAQFALVKNKVNYATRSSILPSLLLYKLLTMIGRMKLSKHWENKKDLAIRMQKSLQVLINMFSKMEEYKYSYQFINNITRYTKQLNNISDLIDILKKLKKSDEIKITLDNIYDLGDTILLNMLSDDFFL